LNYKKANQSAFNRSTFNQILCLSLIIFADIVKMTIISQSSAPFLYL